jgi:hypothetical protein
MAQIDEITFGFAMTKSYDLQSKVNSKFGKRWKETTLNYVFYIETNSYIVFNNLNVLVIL